MYPVLKAKFPNVKVYAVEPALSPVISGGDPAPTPFKALAQVDLANLKTELLDGTIQVDAEPSREYRAARPKKAFWWESPAAPRWPPLPKTARSTCRGNGTGL